jgi:hypothetical protein
MSWLTQTTVSTLERAVEGGLSKWFEGLWSEGDFCWWGFLFNGKFKFLEQTSSNLVSRFGGPLRRSNLYLCRSSEEAIMIFQWWSWTVSALLSRVSVLYRLFARHMLPYYLLLNKPAIYYYMFTYIHIPRDSYQQFLQWKLWPSCVNALFVTSYDFTRSSSDSCGI